MKSKVIETCWDRYQVIATMLCDLRCKMEELQEELHNISIEADAMTATETDAWRLEEETEDIATMLGDWENLFDEYVEQNKPF